MNAYLFPIKFAFITFPIAALFLTLPFLIVQYRKYGYVNKVRAMVLYSMLLYFISAYYLVILPLPQNVHNCLDRAGAVFEQLRPFQFVRDIVKESRVEWSHPTTYVLLLKERAFIQAAFNVVLTLPLGVYMRYYYRRSFLQTTAIACFVSLFFEVTQRTGLYGIYDCPYRLFDVDDLILNTLGGIVGFLLAPVFTYFLPRSHQLDDHIDLTKKPVGFIRRGIAVWLDLTLLSIIMGCMYIVYRSLVYGDKQSINFQLSEFNMLYFAAGILVYFVIIPLFTEGKTFGKWVTRIHLVQDDIDNSTRTLTFMGLMKRYGLLYFGVGGINYVFGYVMRFNEAMDPMDPIVTVLVFIAWAGFNGLLFLHLLLHMFKKDKRLFYEKISRTRNVITIPERMQKDRVGGSASSNAPSSVESTLAEDGVVLEQGHESKHKLEFIDTDLLTATDASERFGFSEKEENTPQQQEPPSQPAPALDARELVEQELARLKEKLAKKEE